MRLLFGLCGIGIIALCILFEGGHFMHYAHPVCFLLVVGTTFFLSLAHHTETELMAAFGGAMNPDGIKREDGKRHIAVLSSCRIIALATGGLGFILGLVHVMGHLDDPTLLGSGIAVALIATLYAVVLSEFFLAPLINRVQCHIESSPKDVEGSSETGLKVAAPSTAIFFLSTFGGLFLLALVLAVLP